MRLKIRDYGCLDECELFVPCKSMIDSIQDYFTNLKFVRLENKLACQLRESVQDGRKKQPVYLKMSDDNRSDNAIRIDRHKMLKQIKADLLVDFYSKNTENTNEISELGDGNVNSIGKGSHFQNPNNPDDLAIILEQSPFMFFENIHSTTGLGLDEPFQTLTSDQIDFIYNQLRVFCERVAKAKNHNLLCGAFIQNPEYPGRTRESIAWNFGLFLDFDTTEWRFYSKDFPKDIEGVKYTNSGWHYVSEETKQSLEKSHDLKFEKNSPITINDLQGIAGINTRIFLHSTFSGGYRRRAFVLYNRLVSPDEHELITHSIYHKINKLNSHWLMDKACLHANALFYLPCKPDTKDVYFNEAGQETLNVDELLCFSISATTIPGPPERTKPSPPVPTEVVKTFTDDAIYEQWVSPIIGQMSKGNRFITAQTATGACKKYCPTMKWKLEPDLLAGGLEKAKVNSMMKWFDRM